MRNPVKEIYGSEVPIEMWCKNQLGYENVFFENIYDLQFRIMAEFIFTECNSWRVCPSIPKKVGQWENFKGKTTTEMEVFLSSMLEFTMEQNSLWSLFWKFKNLAWLFSFSWKPCQEFFFQTHCVLYQNVTVTIFRLSILYKTRMKVLGKLVDLSCSTAVPTESGQ